MVKEYFSSERVVEDRLYGLETKIQTEVTKGGGTITGRVLLPSLRGQRGPPTPFTGRGQGHQRGSSTASSGWMQGDSTPAAEHLCGHRAGYTNTSGACNTFMGYQAGYSNITGTQQHLHRVCGRLRSTPPGYENTFIGHKAGYSNTTGYYNTFSGYKAGVLQHQRLLQHLHAGMRPATPTPPGHSNTFTRGIECWLLQHHRATPTPSLGE